MRTCQNLCVITDSADEAKNIKEQIAVAIVNKDYDTLLRLSSELANTDETKVRFTIDASHVSRLGLELVAKQETAVAELVKNGYDADATHVDLIFRDTDTASAYGRYIGN